VPSLSTSYSITNYEIDSTGSLMGTVFGTNSSGIYTLTNDELTDSYLDSSSSCYFGTYFRSGYIGQVSEVKLFMPVYTRANFIGKLKF